VPVADTGVGTSVTISGEVVVEGDYCSPDVPGLRERIFQPIEAHHPNPGTPCSTTSRHSNLQERKWHWLQKFQESVSFARPNAPRGRWLSKQIRLGGHPKDCPDGLGAHRSVAGLRNHRCCCSSTSAPK